MNVLIFVMSMLMVIALMTYAKLGTYRAMSGIEGEFTRYMESIERTFINMSADKAYDRVAFKKKNDGEDEDGKGIAPAKQPRRKSSGRLSLYPLVDPKVKKEAPKEYEETVSLFKRLIHVLYGRHKSFQELLQKRPTLLDELIKKIPEVVEALPQAVSIQKAADLSNLELGDELDEPFYLMLKGCPTPIKLSSPPSLADAGEDNADDTARAEEYMSDKSYDSLLNFVDLHKDLKINVYIASKALLLAFYGDPGVVDNIIKTRAELYKMVEQKAITDADATERFKSQFQLTADEGLLEYKVTGSDPRRYN